MLEDREKNSWHFISTINHKVAAEMIQGLIYQEDILTYRVMNEMLTDLMKKSGLSVDRWSISGKHLKI